MRRAAITSMTFAAVATALVGVPTGYPVAMFISGTVIGLVAYGLFRVANARAEFRWAVARRWKPIGVLMVLLARRRR
jgi:hypothetical protein